MALRTSPLLEPLRGPPVVGIRSSPGAANFAPLTRKGKVPARPELMYVHRKANATFLANPRTASRSVAEALQGVGFVMEGSHHSYDRSRARGVVFCVVRPIPDTLRSWGRHFRVDPARTELVFKLLEGTRPIIPGWEGWTLFPYATVADRLLRFERLEDNLNELLAELGLPAVELPHIR